MAYELTKSDGTTLTILENGTIDNASSSLTYVGKNVVNYGEIQNENFLKLLENFAHNTEPVSKIRGQLWFDTGDNTLKVYNDSYWKTIATISISNTTTNSLDAGSFYFNSITKQLFINNSGVFELVGPENSANSSITRFRSETIKDISNIDRSVIKCYIENQVIGILSTTSFSINSSNSVPGFSTLVAGMTWKNAETTDFQSYGYHYIAENSKKLLADDGSTYISSDITASPDTIVQRNNESAIAALKIEIDQIDSSNDAIAVNKTLSVKNILPDQSGVYNLGSEIQKWDKIHSNEVNSISGNYNSVNVSNLAATDLQFATLTDENLVSVNAFDTTLSSNVNKLATSKAIKDYIDAAIQTELNARIASDNTLSNRIDLLGYPIPTGTVVYIASAVVPLGWLECAGQLLDKQQYEKLYLVLGSGTSVNQYQFRNIDLRGEFIRGWDRGRGIDPGRQLLTAQSSQNLSHGHILDDIRYSEIWGSAVFTYNDPLLGPINVGPGPGSSRGVDYDNGVFFQQHGTYKEGGTEARPRNVALMPIIKY